MPIIVNDNTRLAHALVTRTPDLPAHGHTANGNTPMCGDTLTVARAENTRAPRPLRAGVNLWYQPGVMDTTPSMTVAGLIASVAASRR